MKKGNVIELMNKLVFLLMISLFFSTCKKENEAYFEGDKNFPTIEINPLKYSYISPEGAYFYSGSFKSTKHIQQFNLSLLEGRKYRISCSQPYSDSATISLSLLQDNDTITVSESIYGQSIIYFNSSKTQTVTLQAQLQEMINISTDYRIYFEELEYDELSLSNQNFSYHGHFESITQDSTYFYPSGSYWYRWLKLNNPINNNSNISYSVINSESNQNIELGFILGGSEELSMGQQFENNLPNGIFFSLKNKQYQIFEIENASLTEVETGSLSNVIDLSDSIHVDIRTSATYSANKIIFINGIPVTEVHSPNINRLYLTFSDRISSPLKICNFNK